MRYHKIIRDKISEGIDKKLNYKNYKHIRRSCRHIVPWITIRGMIKVT